MAAIFEAIKVVLEPTPLGSLVGVIAAWFFIGIYLRWLFQHLRDADWLLKNWHFNKIAYKEGVGEIVKRLLYFFTITVVWLPFTDRSPEIIQFAESIETVFIKKIVLLPLIGDLIYFFRQFIQKTMEIPEILVILGWLVGAEQWILALPLLGPALSLIGNILSMLFFALLDFIDQYGAKFLGLFDVSNVFLDPLATSAFVCLFVRSLLIKPIREQFLIEAKKRIQSVKHFWAKEKATDADFIKKKGKPISKKQPDPEKITQGTLSSMYYYDPLFKRWFLKEKYIWCRYLYIISIVGIILFAYFKKWNNGSNYYDLSVLGFILATDLLLSCAGYTRREFVDRLDLKQEEDMEMLLSTARKIAKQENFIEKIENGTSMAPSRLSKNEDEFLYKLYVRQHNYAADDYEGNLVDLFIGKCKREGIDCDPLLAMPLKYLLKGQSLFFATRFYKDVDYVFTFTLLRELQNGHTGLVLMGEPTSERQLENWIKHGIEKISGCANWWKVGKPEKKDHPIEIGLWESKDIGNQAKIRNCRPFLQKVGIVLIINALPLVRKQMFGIMNLAKELPKDCVFIICGDNAVGIKELYSHLLNIELLLSYPTTKPAEKVIYLFSKKENTVMAGMGAIRYNQFKLAEKLREADVSDIRWYGGNTIPIRSIAGEFADISIDEDDADLYDEERLILGKDMASCPQRNLHCLILEDELRNPAEISRQFASRGKKAAIIAVISPPFPLRNYIWNHIQKFQEDLKCIAQVFPAYCMSERNAVLQILWALETNKIEEDYIYRICDVLGQIDFKQEITEENHISAEKLQNKIIFYTQDADLRVLEDWEPRPLNWRGGSRKKSFSLHASSSYKSKGHCYCYYIDETMASHQLPQYTREQLCQKYLPMQTIVLDGKYYHVEGIFFEEPSSVRLGVCRADPEIRSETSLGQRREVTLLFEKSIAVYKQTPITIELFDACFLVSTLGRWELIDGSTLDFIPLRCKFNEYTRGYYHKQMLKLTLPCEESCQSHPFRDFLAKLLAHLFLTVYAEYRDQLLICIPEDSLEPNEAVMPLQIKVDTCTVSEINTIYIFEDSNEDIGLLDSIAWNFDRYIRILMDIISG